MSGDSSSQYSKQSRTHRDEELRLFALIIGINDYSSNFRKLTGAVADANGVERYLKEELGVPQDHIRKMCDSEATRKAIIKGFRDLREDSRIRRNDAILIFFAGHGSETNAPDGWDTERGMIQLILPQDCVKVDQKIVNTIPDRTIAGLLEDLARVKGNNITVVLDCCHSHSGTREDDNIARFAELEGTLILDLDSDVATNEERSPFNARAFLHHGLRSHVLLAACGSGELARESDHRGRFTKALIDTLSKLGVSKLTYTDLIASLPTLPGQNQNPHCEGHHKDRYLFAVNGADPSFILVENVSNTYMLMAGEVHGMTPGSQFNVYADRTYPPTISPLCTLRASEIGPTQTALEPINGNTGPELPKPAYARQVDYGSAGKLKVHFTDQFSGTFVQKLLVEANAGLTTERGNVRFPLTKANEAVLLVDVDTKSGYRKATFSTKIQHGRNTFFERFKLTLHASADSTEDISRVLRLVGHWNWHFERRGFNEFRTEVSLEFYRLEQVNDSFDGENRNIWKPIEPIQNVNVNGTINITVDPRHRFGAKIINKSDRDLYPYLFYFEVKDQKIFDYKLGSAGTGMVDPPLLARSHLTVGYGATGGAPFTFKGAGGEDQVGFFKIFLTTSSTNMASLIHSSPFEPPRYPDREYEPTWDSVTVKVVERLST